MKMFAIILVLLSTPTVAAAWGSGAVGGVSENTFPPTIPDIDADKVNKFYSCFFKAGCNPFTLDLSDENK